MSKIMDLPPCGLLNWAPCWADEPRPRQPWVTIWIWIPSEIARQHIDQIADYVEESLALKVARTVGWSGGGTGSLLGHIAVTVGAKEVRRRLAEAF